MNNKSYEIEPSVDPTREFIEIAYDFANPLDLVREAISNSFDAEARKIEVLFDVVSECGEKVLQIVIVDDGHGMDENELKSFFDLGNSTRRDNSSAIGEKGHGTKVYFNSSRIEVTTTKSGIQHVAIMDCPIKKLHNNEIPKVFVTMRSSEEPNGTKIVINGYNNNRRDRFTHSILKDYVLWFTKMGSVEKEFGIFKNEDIQLVLKGVDRREPEIISFGHIFPDESKSVTKLFEDYLAEAPKWFCKKILKSASLKNFPEIQFDAIFCIEGTKIKYSYNDMIRRSGYSAPNGAYTVQERYGLWLCKDFIPTQKKNEWITQKGSEYTRFHAFVNCQDLRLTANRGSIDNTPSEIIEDVRKAVIQIYEEIIKGDDWINLEWLENEAASFNTVQREKSDFEWRLRRIQSSKIADYKGIRLIEPTQENGVFSIFMQLKAIEPDLFPFTVVDYDTHIGIDVIVKSKSELPINETKLFYVEFKNYLKNHFNHSFVNLHSIVCWDIDTRIIKNGDVVTDISQQKRILKIIPPANTSDYTRYYLDDDRSERKIEVIVLKKYLEEVAGIAFRVRTAEDTY